MDQLWSFWKCLCCGNEERAFQTALAAKNYVFCARDIYHPLTPREYCFDPPFFIEGQYIATIVMSDDGMIVDDGKLEYRFSTIETTIKSHHKESTTQFRVCCGCPVEDPEDTYQYLRERPVVRQEIPNQQGEHAYEFALRKIEELNSETPIGMFKLSSYSNDASEHTIREKRYQKALRAFKVPFLICSIPECSYRPWVELVDYKHLSIRTAQKMTVTEKMLNCGFLNVNAILTNPEELENFKGFGLIIGRFDKNGFSFDRLFHEIAYWKSNSPSSLQCFGLCKDDIKCDDSFAEFLERLKTLLPMGDMVRVHEAPFNVEAMFLDSNAETAVLFVRQSGICFVRGGIEKWIGVLRYLDL